MSCLHVFEWIKLYTLKSEYMPVLCTCNYNFFHVHGFPSVTKHWYIYITLILREGAGHLLANLVSMLEQKIAKPTLKTCDQNIRIKTFFSVSPSKLSLLKSSPSLTELSLKNIHFHCSPSKVLFSWKWWLLQYRCNFIMGVYVFICFQIKT